MTLTNTTVNVTYQGDASNTSFPIVQDYMDTDEIFVYEVDYSDPDNEVETLKFNLTDYTLTGSGVTGLPTTVLMVTAPAANRKLRIKRIVALTQDLDLQTGGNFPSATIEETFDRLVMMIQQVDANGSTGSGSGSGSSALPTIFGSRASPRSIVSTDGIVSASQHMGTTIPVQNVYIRGSVAGQNDITANPQIQAGTSDGQEMTLIGRDDTKTVLLEDGNGLSLKGAFEMGADDILELRYDGSVWVEKQRNR